MNDFKDTIKGLERKARTEQESLLISILLESIDLNSKIEENNDEFLNNSKKQIDNLSENLKNAGTEYIDILDKYTESKKNELVEFTNDHLKNIIGICLRVESSLNEIKELKKEEKNKSWLKKIFS